MQRSRWDVDSDAELGKAEEGDSDPDAGGLAVGGLTMDNAAAFDNIDRALYLEPPQPEARSGPTSAGTQYSVTLVRGRAGYGLGMVRPPAPRRRHRRQPCSIGNTAFSHDRRRG